MKIKVQKEMTFLEALELLKDNVAETQIHSLNRGKHIDISKSGLGFYSESESISFHEKFTIEVFEEIEYDTILSKILFNFTWNNDHKINSQIRNNVSINDILNFNEKNNKTIKTIYYINDLGRTNLIWDQGKIVE